MRILYLHQYFVTPEQSGGTRSFEFATRWVRAGHRVTVVTADRAPDAPSRRESIEAGIQVVWLGVPYSNWMPFRHRIMRFAQFACRASREVTRHPADVIYASSTPLTIILPAAVAKWYHRAALVFEVRDLWPDVPIAMGALRGRVSIGIARVLEWWAYRMAAAVVALSPGMADGVRRAAGSDKRVMVIPNAADLALFASQREAGTPPDEGHPEVLYVGTLGLVNEVEYLVRLVPAMLAVVPGATLRIVGDGAGRPAVEAAIQRLAPSHRKAVQLGVPVKKSEVPRLMDHATVTASVCRDLPALFANSANKFFDSLAAGRPIVINYGGWQADLIRQHGAGIVLPRDPDEAGRLLGEFLRDRERIRAASGAAAALGVERFSRDDLAAQALSLVEDVVRASKVDPR